MVHELLIHASQLFFAKEYRFVVKVTGSPYESYGKDQILDNYPIIFSKQHLVLLNIKVLNHLIQVFIENK